MPGSRKHNLRETLILGLLSMIPYVSWAIYVNYSYGIDAIIQVSITQSALSFLLTVSLTQSIIYFYHIGSSISVKNTSHTPSSVLSSIPETITIPIVFPISLAVIGSSLFSNLIVVSTHYFAGTPNILITMLPGSILGLLYSVIYSLRLAGKLDRILNKFKKRY